MCTNLNNDCLLIILEIITSRTPGHKGDTRILTRSDRPLNILRSVSQVCQQWRESLLRSSRLWGRVVDLDVEDHGPRRGEWMDEVLTRAGSAPLWISGNVVEPKKDSRRVFKTFNTQAFFIRLLESWQKIEKLSVYIPGDENQIPIVIQQRFLSPAPLLKVFDVFLPDSRPLFFQQGHIYVPIQPKLFLDNAPLLEEIRAERVTVRLDAPWLSGIRKIVPFPNSFTLQDILALLKKAPLLESVLLTRGHVHEPHIRDAGPLRPLDLPNLSSIGLNTTFGATARFLNFATPRKLSDLWIEVIDSSSRLMDDYVFYSFNRNLPLYYMSYFASSPSEQVQVDISSKSFSVNDIVIRGEHQRPSFDISAKFSFLMTSQENKLMSCLLQTFIEASRLGGVKCKKKSLFESIKEMRLKFFHPNPTIFIDVYGMLAEFEKIEHIKIDEHSFHILLVVIENANSSSASELLFPNLYSMSFSTFPWPYDKFDRYIFLLNFLSERKRIGCPIAKLDLTPCRQTYRNQDLTSLEAISGLEVSFRQSVMRQRAGIGERYCSEEVCRYVCGSGDPQRLKGIF